MDKVNILLFEDTDDVSQGMMDVLNEVHGDEFEAKLIKRPSECLSRVHGGLSKVQVIVIHKDLGDHAPEEWNLGITSDKLVDEIHQRASEIWIGIISGEYPHGKSHVLGMGADFYCDKVSMLTWGIEQTRKGWVSAGEKENRGRVVEMPGA